MLSVKEKIYAQTLVDRVHKMTEGLIDDEQIGEKVSEKKCSVCVFY